MFLDLWDGDCQISSVKPSKNRLHRKCAQQSPIKKGSRRSRRVDVLNSILAATFQHKPKHVLFGTSVWLNLSTQPSIINSTLSLHLLVVNMANPYNVIPPLYVCWFLNSLNYSSIYLLSIPYTQVNYSI